MSKPWGDSAWDVGIDRGPHFLRVQVKSTTHRTGTGYACEFKPNLRKARDYTLEQVDLFAAYVVPVDAWYLYPRLRDSGAAAKNATHAVPGEPAQAGQLQVRALPRGLGIASRNQT